MIHIYTDFGLGGPYVGQMHAVLAEAAPSVPRIDLMHDAPRFAPVAAGILLAAICHDLPPGGVVLAVVDPGVGSARRGIVLRAGGRWLVGPDNGLLAFATRIDGAEAWEITWQPPGLSASFHGRDLFAPVAARLAMGEAPPGTPIDPLGLRDAGREPVLSAVIYIDDFGNAMTGLVPPADGSAPIALGIGGEVLGRARTFSDVPPGEAFWYENALGLVEIAVNQGSAAGRLGLSQGVPVSWVAAQGIVG